MISVNGYKAFYGKLLIQYAPYVRDLPPFEEGPCEWLFSPEDKCWHSSKNSYSELVATPINNNIKSQVD